MLAEMYLDRIKLNISGVDVPQRVSELMFSTISDEGGFITFLGLTQ